MSRILDRITHSELKRQFVISTTLMALVLLIVGMVVLNLDAHVKRTGEFKLDPLQWQALIVALVCAARAHYWLPAPETTVILEKAEASPDVESERMLVRTMYLALVVELFILLGQSVFTAFTPSGDFEIWRGFVVIGVGVASQVLWYLGRKAAPFSCE